MVEDSERFVKGNVKSLKRRIEPVSELSLRSIMDSSKFIRFVAYIAYQSAPKHLGAVT